MEDLAQSLKTIFSSDSPIHCLGFGLHPANLHHLVGLLRARGVEVIADQPIAASGSHLAIFSASALTPMLGASVAHSASGAPKGKKVIDCEGYTYLLQA